MTALGASERSKSLLKRARTPQERSKSLLKPARRPHERSKSLLEPARKPQKRSKSLLKPARSHKSASKPLLQPASWCSKSPVQYHCSKSLFEDAGLCDTLLCSPLLLLYLPPCMDMHGFTLVSDISDDHIRGPYKGGMPQGRKAQRPWVRDPAPGPEDPGSGTRPQGPKVLKSLGP